MIKLLAITLFAASLGACSSMYGNRDGVDYNHTQATKNSSNSAAERVGNPAAVSPGGGAGAAGSGAGSR